MQYNFSGDGNSDTVKLKPGDHIFEAQGTFGGGTVKVQTDRGLGYIDVPGVSLTSDGQQLFTIPADATARVNLSGASSPDLDVILD